MIKVHKTPWKTRPIVSYCGSLAYGLRKWLDQQLQPICQQLPSLCWSSVSLLQDLCTIDLSQNCSLFTMDAVSMYTNIEVDHAMTIIPTFLRTSPLCNGRPTKTIIKALEIILCNNLFQFGNTFWKQSTGVAIGTPPACCIAMLYYGIHELRFVPTLSHSLLLYQRYIDDGFGIWQHHPDPLLDRMRWRAFRYHTRFGNLKWVINPLSQQVNFLDLTLTIKDGTILSNIYEKPSNLYTYLPPLSCHSPGVTYGTIYRIIKRAHDLISSSVDICSYICQCFQQFIRQGYNFDRTLYLFKKALHCHKLNLSKPLTPSDPHFTIFQHIQFHPDDPPYKLFQKLFFEHILKPTGEHHITCLKNFEGGYIPINKLIVAYHNPKKLRHLLFPCQFDEGDKFKVSNFLFQNTQHLSLT